MRSLRFLPLVFLIGIDGFVMFAPYVVLVLSVAYVTKLARSLTTAAEAEPIPAPVTA